MFEAEELFPRKDLGGMSHASTITEGSNGELYCVWYAGTWEKEADVAIYMSVKQKGKDWSTPVLIEKEGVTSENPFLDEAEDDEEREELKNEETSEGNPVIFADLASERLWLFWETMRGAGKQSGWTMCVLKMKDSTDWGKTWSEPKLLRRDIGWGTRNKPIWASNNELILPIAAGGSTGFYRTTKEEFSQGAHECNFTEPDVFILRGSQPSVIETNDKILKCFMRTNDKSGICANLVAVSESEDYGHTWTKIHPTKDNIPNPDSGLDAVTLDNGHVILVCNPLSEGRQKLTVFLSEDNGITFPYSRDLEPIEDDKSYHYPAVIQTSDGLIHVVYTFRRLNIKHACFDEDWIKNS